MQRNDIALADAERPQAARDIAHGISILRPRILPVFVARFCAVGWYIAGFDAYRAAASSSTVKSVRSVIEIKLARARRAADTMASMQYERELHFARSVAMHAGELAVGYQSRELKPESKPDLSPVTIADRECERLIAQRIEEEFPDDGILGEEGSHKESRNGRRWIIDPIDGTRDFVRQLAALVGAGWLEVDGEVVAGVSNLAPRKEMYSAIRGGGAWRNDSRISISSIDKPQNALICVNGMTRLYEFPFAASIIDWMSQFWAVRSLGGCLDAMLVASGHAELWIEMHAQRVGSRSVEDHCRGVRRTVHEFRRPIFDIRRQRGDIRPRARNCRRRAAGHGFVREPRALAAEANEPSRVREHRAIGTALLVVSRDEQDSLPPARSRLPARGHSPVCWKLVAARVISRLCSSSDTSWPNVSCRFRLGRPAGSGNRSDSTAWLKPTSRNYRSRRTALTPCFRWTSSCISLEERKLEPCPSWCGFSLLEACLLYVSRHWTFCEAGTHSLHTSGSASLARA